MFYPELYKKDTKGKIRVWYVEQDGSKYRVIAGLLSGKLVTAEWTDAEPKNIGKTNETTAKEQAAKEIKSLYETQLEQGRYFDNLADVDNETYFKPMLAHKLSDYENLVRSEFAKNKKVFASKKYDGFRLVTSSKGMFTREGKEYISCPHISYNLIHFFAENPNIVLDGELYNHEYHDNFNKIQSLLTKKKPTKEDLAETEQKVKYYVYDIFDKNNPDLIFSERLELLKQVYDHINLLKVSKYYEIVNHWPCASFEDIDMHYADALENNYEGQVIRLDTPYENKRSKYLLKRKEFFDAEYIIRGIETGVGNWAGVPKVMSFVTEDGQSFNATLKGSREELTEKFSDEAKWIGKLATVRFPGYLPSGKPRQGIITNVYDSDKRDI